jgi:hypothetical protein
VIDASNLLSTWEEVQREFSLRNEHVLAELDQAWNDAKAILNRTAAALANARPGAAAEPADLNEHLFGTEAAVLFLESAEMVERRRPAQRIVTALASYDTSIDDVWTALPVVAELPPDNAFAIAGRERMSAWALLQYRRAHPGRGVRLRECARTSVHLTKIKLSQAEGRLLIAATQSILHAVGAWQIWRQASLTQIGAPLHAANEAGLVKALSWWRQATAELIAAGDEALRSLHTQTAESPARLRQSLLKRPAKPTQVEKLAARRRTYLQYWSRVQRDVQTQVELNLASLRIEQAAVAETVRLMQSLEREHRELAAELDGVLEWLRSWNGLAAVRSFPPPHATLISAEERGDEWLRSLAHHARVCLPTTAESVVPRFPLPSRRMRWRLLEPRAAFLNVMQGYGQNLVLAPLRDAEAGHRAIVREVEHAREVFAFGQETAQSGDAESLQVAMEAVSHAIALLDYQRRSLREVRTLCAPGMTLAVVRVLLEYHETLDRDRLGLLARAGQRRGLLYATRAAESVHVGVQWTARRTKRLTSAFYRAALRQIGLLPPEPAGRQATEQMAALNQVLSIRVRTQDLPAIYRRLFRVAPVEDQRFLVGRREELAGIDDAFGRWMIDESASVMVVGARGSGKTSLLNCAVQRFDSSVETIRGQFSDRVTTARDLEAALRRILRLPCDVPLLDFLRQRKRVLVVEEFERAFLRTVDGFAAVRHFIDLMQLTAGQVLWVVSTNESSYPFLKATCGVDQFFSHRINAMSVSQDALTAAILQRHNLSGLRLQFAPVPPSDPRVGRLKNFFGLAQESQQLFFDSLYQQSDGIYRSAFELWQDCVERVEAGVIHMAQPLAPEYDGLARELNLEDCFALQAVRQHGSLTPDELSEVLRLQRPAANRRIQRLLELQILEPEPAGPGFRVKPQGGRFVRDVLHRRNLA